MYNEQYLNTITATEIIIEQKIKQFLINFQMSFKEKNILYYQIVKLRMR